MFTSRWPRSWKLCQKARIRQHSDRGCRLAVDALEDRLTPAAGSLDPTFGSGGIAFSNLSQAFTVETAVRDSSGGIIVAGQTFNGANNDFALTRFSGTGQLDTSFGANGMTILDLGGGYDFASALAIDGTGGIVVAGYAENGFSGLNFALAKFNAGGQLDTDFGTNGIVLQPVSIGFQIATALAIDAAGGLIVAGYADGGSDFDFAVTRFTATGQLDTGFGTNGVVLQTIGFGYDYAEAMVIDANGGIILAGRASNGNDDDFALARFTAAGQLDAGFGNNGIVLQPIGPGYDSASALVIDAAGRIVVAGSDSNDFALARFSAGGQLDPTFGANGVVVHAIGSRSAVNAVTLESTGRILIAGSTTFSQSTADADLAIARFNNDGTVDLTFGANGSAVKSLTPNGPESWKALMVQADGRIVVAGNTNPTIARPVLGRYLANNPPGLTLATGQVSYFEDAAPLAIDATLTLTDDFGTIVSAAVQIGNYVRGQDVLGYSIPANSGISASFDDGPGVLTFSGSASAGVYQTLLRSLTYRNTSQGPNEIARTITIAVNDGDAFDAIASASRVVLVRAINDAPAFSDDGALPAIPQGASNPAGKKIATIFAGLFDDPDAGSSLSGIAVVANGADVITQGEWQYSLEGTTWLAVGSVTNAAALALAAETRLRFLPISSFVGSVPALSVRAIDNTYGGAFTTGSRMTIDATINGAATAIAANVAGATATVLPNGGGSGGNGGNAPPIISGVPTSASINEGFAYAFTASASDPEGQPVSFSLIGAPAGAAINSSTGGFTWTPSEVQGPDVFGFLVRADDGTTHADFYVTLTVREINSAPVLANVPSTLFALRGTTPTFTAGVTDADQVHGEANAISFSLVGAPTGAFIHTDTGVFNWPINGDATPGDYRFEVRAADDGVPSKSVVQAVTITVSPASLVNGELCVVGTNGNDVIGFVPIAPDRIEATLNGNVVASVNRALVTRLCAHGLGGADKITVSDKLAIDAELFGDDGNDSMSSGSGNDTLRGGQGDDKLTGGIGNDVYVFEGFWGKDGVVENTKQGTDRLDFSAASEPVTVTVSGSATVAASGSRRVEHKGREIEAVVGSTGLDDTLMSDFATNKFQVTSKNAGTLNAVFAFSEFENLTGGKGADSFAFSPAAGVDGTIDGRSGSNLLDYSAWTEDVNVNLQANTASGTGGAIGITGVVGSKSLNDRLIGADRANTWFFNLPNAGNINNSALVFSGIENFHGGSQDDTFIVKNAKTRFEPFAGTVSGAIDGAGGTNSLRYSGNLFVSVNLQARSASGIAGGFSNISAFQGGLRQDTLIGANLINTWDLTGANTGTINQTTTFSSFENLIGGGLDDTFSLEKSGSISGSLQGGGLVATNTVSYSTRSAAVKVNLATGNWEDIGGTPNEITKVIGGNRDDTLTAKDSANLWNIDKIDGGNLNGSLSFESFENQVGGEADDTWTLAEGGRVTESIIGLDGVNALSYEPRQSAVYVELNNYSHATPGASGYASNVAIFHDISSFHGGSGSDRFTGAGIPNDWLIYGENAFTLNQTMSPVSFENLEGGWNGNTFTFAEGGSLTGSLDGHGGSTLSYAPRTTAVAITVNSVTEFDRLAGQATDIGGGIYNVSDFVGSSVADNFTGDVGDVRVWTIEGSDTFSLEYQFSGPPRSYVTTKRVSSFENLIGGSSIDSFHFNEGASVSGSIAGGGGINELVYDCIAPVRVNLAFGTATGVGFGIPLRITNFDKAFGGKGNDILVGNNVSNTLVGGLGRDILIGGGGADLLAGDGGDDILINCSTTHDLFAQELEQIMDEWAGPNSYQTRVRRLSGLEGNLSTLLNASTIIADIEADRAAIGSTGTDWFILNGNDLGVQIEPGEVVDLLP